MAESISDWREQVTVSPDVQGGRPVIKGTRMPVHVVLGSLAAGMSVEKVCEQYDLNEAQVRAALGYAAEALAARTERLTVADREFTVSIGRDRKWWIGSVAELPGCGSQGRTLAELREMLADAILSYLIVRGDLPEDAATHAAL